MLHERIYLDETDKRVYMDTYVVNDKSMKRDAILVIPGGGYGVVCTEREGEPIALAYVREGLNAFVLNYRVGQPGDHYPKQLIDVGHAILFIKNNAERFGIDPNRVFTVGFSAGGHLSGTAAMMYGEPEVKEALGITGDENKPCGSVLAYPVVTANTPITHQKTFENLLGKPFAEFTDEERRKFSLETRIDEKSAPIFIWHTSRDELVPLNGSLLLTQAAVDKGQHVAAHIYPYGPHGLALANKLTECGIPEYVQPLAENWIVDSVKWMRTL